MTRLSVCVPLLLAGIASAQQPSTYVQDLLTGEANQSRAEHARFVRRVAFRRDWPELPRVVAGERLLMGDARDDDPFLKPRPFFSEQTLLDLVRDLRPGVDNGLDLLRFGERVELRSRAPEVLQAALADVRAALPPRVTCSLRLERQVGDETTVLLQGSQEFANGETLVVGDVEQTSQVVDVEVEIAQASMVGNPVKFEVTYGSSAALRVRPLPWTGEAIVECVLRHAAPFEERAMPRSSTIGQFDRHATRVDEAGLTFRIANGQATTHQWQAFDGSTLRIVCEASWQPQPRTTVAVLSPLLNDPVVGFRSTHRGEPDDPIEMLPVGQMVRSRIEEQDDGGDGSARWLGRNGSNVLVCDGADQQADVRNVFAEVDASLRAVTTTLEVLSVPAGAAISPRGEWPADTRRLWRASGPAVAGLPSCFSSGRQRSFVRDWDVEVAQAARISDPKVSICEDGWFATVKPLPKIAGQAPRAELALQQIDFVALERLALVVGEQVNASTDSQKVVLPREELSIEKAVTRAVEVAATVTLDEQGAAVLRRSAARTLGEGRELVVRLIVR